MADPPSTMDPAHDALNRMKRAYERRTGCHLTERMIEALGRTFIGQAWAEEDPRQDAPKGVGHAQ